MPVPELADLGGSPGLVWRLAAPVLAISSAALGGGLGVRNWVFNRTVPAGYDHPDPAAHLAALAAGHGLTGPGVGMLTAVDVRAVRHRSDTGVRVSATTGIGHPTWAAAAPEPVPAAAGTINVVAWLPARLSEGALVNAIATVAEAKAQALAEAGVAGTGTCTDATVLLCPPTGPAQPYGGPRSELGAPLARAVHAAIAHALPKSHR